MMVAFRCFEQEPECCARIPTTSEGLARLKHCKESTRTMLRCRTFSNYSFIRSIYHDSSDDFGTPMDPLAFHSISASSNTTMFKIRSLHPYPEKTVGGIKDLLRIKWHTLYSWDPLVLNVVHSSSRWSRACLLCLILYANAVISRPMTK